MARITVEDCLGSVENRFELVMVASKRARAIATGGKDPLVPEEGDKPAVLALRELAAGVITPQEIMAAQEERAQPQPQPQPEASSFDLPEMDPH